MNFRQNDFPLACGPDPAARAELRVDAQHRGTLATVISMTGAPVLSGQITGIRDKIGEWA
jgi:hypothetical protein